MADRAPASVWFYLDERDAALFKQIHAARTGGAYDEDEHDKLIAAGFLELDPYNPQPDGTCMNDVRLTSKGEAEINRLARLAAERFEAKRRGVSRGVVGPNSSGVERASSRSVGPKSLSSGHLSKRARGASDPARESVSRATPLPTPKPGDAA